MRALILALFLIFTPMSAAMADNDVGCGVGTMIWDGNEGLLYKIMASSTNGITFQSISITFGLLNCNGRDTVTANARLRHFAAANIDRLARDSAVGRGESLDTLATILEVRDGDRAAFGQFAQSHFSQLFPSDRVTSEEMLQSLDALLRESQRLSIYAL
jgi:hypothetical protein